MNIPLVDLKAQYLSIKDEIDLAIQKTIDSTQFVLGPETTSFERDMADYLGVGYGVGVASGTDALHLALLACGIGPGDEVITTPFTFVATAETVQRCGATPVFVDINADIFNIDTSKIEPKITKKTKAILPVHLFGQAADMDDIRNLAQKYGLKVVEDCAQSFGARYKGKKTGCLGDASCLSFFPSKILGAYGDGGMVMTGEKNIADMVEILRNHGSKDKYIHILHGFNSRLDSIQAAILRVKLKHIDDWIKRRREQAELYATLLKEVPDVKVPYVDANNYHVFNYYTLRVTGKKINRDGLQNYLNSKGVATAIYYPLSLHLQEVYRSLNLKAGDYPQSEMVQKEVISLPIYPELEDEQIRYIAGQIRNFCQ
jgi:dTDP-4-amino-4,6-dideoxygalactose transaminase